MKIKTFLATAILFSMTSAPSFAFNTPTCINDVNQMRSQIDTYQSITSHDGYRFNGIEDPSPQEMNICSASGYYFGKYVCIIKWQLGNWGDTFHCE